MTSIRFNAVHSTRRSACARTFPGIMLFTILLIASLPASSQVADNVGHAQPVANLNDSALGRARTPQEVLNGTARLVGRFDPNSKLRVVLGLTPPKLAEEEQFLKELQDKKSPNFHKYLTAAQWNARFAPSAADEQAVVDWATNNGLTVTKRFPNRLIVDVEGTSETLEKAFAVNINNYQLGLTTEFSNDRDPVIPAHLAGILHSVGGLNSIQRVHAPHEGNTAQQSAQYQAGPVSALGSSAHGDGSKTAFDEAMKAAEERGASSRSLKGLSAGGNVIPDVTSGYIDPTDIYSSYGYDYAALQRQGHCCNPTHDSGGSTPTSSIAIATAYAFAGSDITGFQSRYSYLAYYYNSVYIDGTPSCCNDETTLDTEWAIATANSFGSYLDTSHVWVYEGANNLLSTFTDVYNHMLSDGHARSFSTSWGCAEFSCWDSGTMDTDHAIFNAMLGQGWTLAAASGDQGAAGGCGNADRVIYPASDPDFIAVGGTTLSLYSDGTFFSENAWQGGTSSGSCSSNNGGSGGGCSAKFAAPGYQTSPFCGSGSRSVPDISLNSGAGQNVYFNGGWYGFGGTSIATPMVAGFIAQENAYLLAIGLGGAPIGWANYPIYYEAHNPSYAAHFPYYDIKSGCNNNDITALYGLGYYCAVAGYDRVTGWGSFNALQLARAISTYHLGDFGAPVVTFSGPTVSTTANTWFNTDQTVSWTVTDTGGGYSPTGVAGFSQAWDVAFSDPTSEPYQGTGNSFYNGPQFPNSTSGFLKLSSAGQGCHYATVDAWDNTGISSGNRYYYWLCYDTIAPTVTKANSPAPNSSGWNKGPVTATLTASDSGTGASGISATYYIADNLGTCSTSTPANCHPYTGPITLTSQGSRKIYYFTKDVAGNVSAMNVDNIYIDTDAPITTSTLTGTLNGAHYDTAVKVTLASTDIRSGVASITYQVDGGAMTTYSAPITVSALGNHTVTFHATDRAGNIEATKSVSFSIASLTTTALTSSINPAVNGQSITFTAHVTASLSGTPTGSVTFKDGATVLGTVALSGGAATLSTSTLSIGTHSITASYGGASNFYASTSAALSEKLYEKTTALITSSANPGTYGHAITLTAKVTPSISGVPTGTVQFYDGATLIHSGTLSGGVATFATGSLAGGTHSLTVKYLGDSTYEGSTSPAISQVLNPASTAVTLGSTLNPSTHGASVTFTATVTSYVGVPTGTVKFLDGATTLGTGTLSGGATTFATSGLAVGTHSITAVYVGNANFATHTSAVLSQKVN